MNVDVNAHMNQKLLDFKKSRVGNKKRNINVTVNNERLTRIENAIKEQGTIFDLLNRTEQIDFMLFMLEGYMFPEQ